MVITLVSIYFGSTRLGYTIKANCNQCLTYDFLRKGLEVDYPPHFMYEVSKYLKNEKIF